MSETQLSSTFISLPSRCGVTIICFILTTVAFVYAFALLAWGVKEPDATGIVVGIILMCFIPFLYAPTLIPYDGWRRAWSGWVWYFRAIFAVLTVIMAIVWVILLICMRNKENNEFSLDMWYPALCTGLILIAFVLILLTSILVGVRFPDIKDQKQVQSTQVTANKTWEEIRSEEKKRDDDLDDYS